MPLRGWRKVALSSGGTVNTCQRCLNAGMQAITLSEFGSPDVLTFQNMPDPLLGPDTVLIETRAAGTNPVDWKIRRGYLRGMISHHTPLIPGWDVSGVVRAAGPAVTEFREGDEVLG